MRTVPTIRTYSELMDLDTFDDRFRYLALGGGVADRTFGGKRWLNQDFYRSRAWKLARRNVIYRDFSCDLGIEGFEVHRDISVHHMNPITEEDLIEFNPDILDPEYLITVSHVTHNAIHYGDERQIPRQFVERTPGDHIPWR